jgi:hypothetical protein
MKARIYRPTRNAMQSGTANTLKWELRFVQEVPLYTDPLMGWTGMTDTKQEIRLAFDSEEEAVDYATKNGIPYELNEPKIRIIKPKSYAANFSFNKVS